MAVEAETDVSGPLLRSAWYHGMSLAERLARRREIDGSGTAGGGRPSERAQQRLERWKAQAPFRAGDLFAERLALDEITEGDLVAALDGVEAGDSRDFAPPAWWGEWSKALHGSEESAVALAIPDQSGASRAIALLAPFRALITNAISRLRAGIDGLASRHDQLPFDPGSVLGLLFAPVPALILGRIDKTLVLELNVARIEGRLVGDTPEARFGHFIEQLSQPASMLALAQEYPVLARQVVEALDGWVAVQLELLTRLCEDWQAIQSAFLPGDQPGVLAEVKQGAGDTHRGGRSVAILGWSSGFRLVYKPRSLAVDVHFQELLTDLNERGQEPDLRALAVLDRGQYGWCEYVRAAGCSTQAEVARFYRRQGAFLAILYALEAVDFHAENLLAAGEHPVLIDLEALLQPYLAQPPINPAADKLAHSVLRIGLLPQRVWAGEDAVGIDLSGLGATAGQLTPTPIPTWAEAGTDQMRIERERLPMSFTQHRPKLNGQDVDILEHLDSVIAGFGDTYRLLIQLRGELVDEITRRFAHDEVRSVLRPSQAYALLLQESFHPDLLRDALERERFFDRLWVGVDQQPHLTKLIKAERRELMQGDIPHFCSRPDSSSVFTAQGEEIPDFFARSGLEMVSRRFDQMDDIDLAQQIWIIRASFASLRLGNDRAISPTMSLAVPSRPASRERLLGASRAVGDRLLQLAIAQGDSVGWLGLDAMLDREWHLLPASTDLYSGTSGIALFLGYLGAVTGEKSYTQVARQALSSVRAETPRQVERPLLAGIGAFHGLGSLIYLLTHLGTIWQDAGLYREAEGVAAALPEAIAQDLVLDVIGGSAGCIAALLSLQAVSPSVSTLELAVACGDRLLATARSMPTGIGWLVPLQEQPLAGFAHGNAGIALSLLRLADASGAERFRAAALDALAYERSLFSQQNGNWPDLRRFPGESQAASGDKHDAEPAFMVAWCHGAAGIGLGRLASLPYLDDLTLREEIAVALETTLARGFGLNHSLCHGDMGNLELIAEAARRFPAQKQHADDIAAMLLDSMERLGWVSATPAGVETPGLMLGLAGVGYGLLRLACPEKLPSVLLLSPPAGRGSVAGLA